MDKSSSSSVISTEEDDSSKTEEESSMEMMGVVLKEQPLDRPEKDLANSSKQSEEEIYKPISSTCKDHSIDQTSFHRSKRYSLSAKLCNFEFVKTLVCKYGF